MDEIPVLHPHRHHYRLILVGVMIGLFGLGLSLVKMSQSNGTFLSSTAATSKRAIPQTPTAAPVVTPVAFFSVTSDSDLTQVQAGQELSLKLYGDSKGRSVQGFDALITLEGIDYDVVSAKSPMFDIIKFIKPTHLTVTAIKKMNISQDVILAPTDVIAEIVIKPRAGGTIVPKIIDSMGRETSKMIFDDATSANGLQKVSATAQDE